VALLPPVMAPDSGPDGRLTGPARVKDGDTIEIAGVAIRLEGIDAPERSQSCEDAAGRATACGESARFALMRLTRERVVTCTGTGLDGRSRRLMRCTTPDTGDLGRALVRAGHALAFRRYSLDYVGDEEVARAAKAGLWAGRFTPPWDERRTPGRLPTSAPGAAAPVPAVPPLAAVPAVPRAVSSRAAAEPAGGCVIKGNHSRRGERIYHRPGQQHYTRTVVDVRAGERWFCTPQEAEAAGYRAALR
jgi:endonuclease YncB( thermonuclease family)